MIFPTCRVAVIFIVSTCYRRHSLPLFPPLPASEEPPQRAAPQGCRVLRWLLLDTGSRASWQGGLARLTGSLVLLLLQENEGFDAAIL